MGLKATMQAAVKEAMKARAKIRLETIRTVLSVIQYEEMNRSVEELPDDAILDVLKSELKKRKESLEFATQGNRQDLIAQLNEEMAVVNSFLPQQMDQAALEALLTQMKATTPGLNMGGAMKLLKERHNGQYDAKSASELAKKIFA